MSRSITRRILSMTLAIWASPVRSCAKPPPAPAGDVLPGAAARSGVPAMPLGPGVVPFGPKTCARCAAAGAGSLLPASASARLLQTGQLKRAWMWNCRPLLRCTGSGVDSGERNRSTSADTVVPNSVVRLFMRSAAPLRPSCSSAPRLAPTILPSGLIARMPSISVPMNSTRL